MIAITGGHSAFGQGLIGALLERGDAVRVLCGGSAPWPSHPNLSVVPGDIQDVTSLNTLMEGAEQVYHLEAINTYGPVEKGQLYRTNVDGTAKVVNAALSQGVEAIFFASTMAALGDRKNGDEFDERARWSNMKLATGYGWSKHLAEREIWRGVAEGLRALIVNTGILLSDRVEDDNSAQVMQYCMRSEGTYPEGIAYLIDVRDAVSNSIRLMEELEDSRQVVFYTHRLSYRELMGKLGSIFSLKPPIKGLSYITLRKQALKGRMFGRLLKKHRPIMTKALAQVLSDRRSFSNFNFLEVQAFEFIDIDESLKLYGGQYDE